MINCDYTAKTNHSFYEDCCNEDENVNIVGLYPAEKIEKILECFPSNSWTQFFIPEIVDIPSKKPDIEGIISVHSNIEIISQRVIKTPIVTDSGCICRKGSTGVCECTGVCSSTTMTPVYNITNSEGTKLTGRKLIVEGILKQKIIYAAAIDEQSVHSAHFAIPFSVFIIIDKDTPLSKKFKVDYAIEDLFTCRLSERSIFKNTTIFIKASPVC